MGKHNSDIMSKTKMEGADSYEKRKMVSEEGQPKP